MSNGKAMVILVIVGSIKKILLYKTSYFPEPYTRSKNKIKAELYLSNYATKSDLNNETGGDTLDFAKSDIDDVNIDQLENVPKDLHKLSNAVKKEFVKKTVYHKLVKKLMVFRLIVQAI